jgi:hypothetical protein
VAQSAETIRIRYFSEVMETVGGQISDIDIAFDMAYTNAAGRFNVTDASSVFDYITPIFFSLFYKLPLVKQVAAGKPDGSVAAWSRTASSNSSGTWYDNYGNYSIGLAIINPIAKGYTTYNGLNFNKAVKIPVKPSPLPDYVVNTMNTTDMIWGLSYVHPSYPGYLFLTLAQAVRDKVTNEYHGCVQFNTDTQLLNTYLKTTAEFARSSTVVIERQTGYLIAASESSVKIFNNTVRYDGTKASDNRVSDMILTARSALGGKNFPKLADSEIWYTKSRVNGEIVAINVGSINDGYGVDWIVIQSVPMKAFFGKFINSIIIMICAAVALLLGSIIISGLLAHLVMSPIRSLIRQSKAIKLLQLETVEEDLKRMSFFTEVKSLQQAFKSMVQRLKQFRNFIPDHILAVIEEEVNANNPNANRRELLTASTTQSSEDGKKTPPSEPATESISGTSGTSRNMVNKALNSTLTSGVVSVMTIKLPDLELVLDQYDAIDIDVTMKELLSRFMDIIKISKGQFVSFTSSTTVVAWNTFIRQSDHKTRAAKAAKNCMAALKKLHAEWKEKGLPLLDVSIGIASANCHYGNVGSNQMKWFTLIGPAANRSAKMCKHGQEWGVQIVCDNSIYDHVKDDYYTRPLTTITDSRGNNVLVHELGDTKAADAWASEINEKDDNNIWRVYNDAYSLFQQGMYDDAHESFVKFMEKYPLDVAAQNMLIHCKAHKDEVTPTLSDNETTTTTVVE